MPLAINIEVSATSTFYAKGQEVDRQLEAFHRSISAMVKQKKKGGTLSVGNADVAVLQQFQKGQWKWAHQTKSNDARMTPDPRSGGPRREQFSTFWCMLNTNKVPEGGADPKEASTTRDDMVEAMAHALTQIQSKSVWWGPRGADMSCFKWGAGKNLTPEQEEAYKKDRSTPSVYIKQVDIEAPKAEQGPNQHRLHMHFIMRIRHFSNIQLHSKGFQLVFKKLYNDYLTRRKNYPYNSPMLFQGDSKPLLWAKLMPQPNSHTWLTAYGAKQAYADKDPAESHGSEFNRKAEQRVKNNLIGVE